MANMLSLRVSKGERRQLQMLRAEKGYRNLSETMRVLMGFPAHSTSDEPFIDGADDIDSVAQLCTLVLRIIDRQDEMIKTVTLIARHVGVPTALNPYQLAAAERNGTPIHPMPNLEGDPLATRGGDKHPDLPDGFSRG